MSETDDYRTRGKMTQGNCQRLLSSVACDWLKIEATACSDELAGFSETGTVLDVVECALEAQEVGEVGLESQSSAVLIEKTA